MNEGGENMKKKIVAIAMLVVMLISAVPFNAMAATDTTVYAPKNNWGNCVTVTLKNSKKDGYAKVSTNAWGERVDIQMLGSNGRVIWSENKTLNTNRGSGNVTREYKLGKGRSVYKLKIGIAHV